jgi:hypothetical protein
MKFGIHLQEQEDGQLYEAWIEATTGEKFGLSAVN